MAKDAWDKLDEATKNYIEDHWFDEDRWYDGLVGMDEDDAPDDDDVPEGCEADTDEDGDWQD